MESDIIGRKKKEYNSLLQAEQISIASLVNKACDMTGECPNDFKCNICLMLVFQPQ